MCLWLLFWLKAQIQNEALQAIYHSKSNKKTGKAFIVEVAAQAAVRTSYLTFLWKFQMQLFQGRAEQKEEAVITPQGGRQPRLQTEARYISTSLLKKKPLL